MATEMITLTPGEREVLEDALKEDAEAQLDIDNEVAEAEAEAEADDAESAAAGSEDEEAGSEKSAEADSEPEYEIKTVFSGPDPTAQVTEAIELNRRALGNLKKQFDEGKISEEEYEAQGQKMADAIQKAEAHLNAVTAYRQEAFKAAVTKYCEEHAAVRQKRSVWNAFSGTANHIHDDLVAKGETPAPEKVLELARLAVEKDFECDLSGKTIVLKRSGEASKKEMAKKPTAEAVKAAIKKEGKKQPPPDIGRYPSAQSQVDKTQFELLDELAVSDPVKFTEEMGKLPHKVLLAYTEYDPGPPQNKGARSA